MGTTPISIVDLSTSQLRPVHNRKRNDDEANYCHLPSLGGSEGIRLWLWRVWIRRWLRSWIWWIWRVRRVWLWRLWRLWQLRWGIRTRLRIWVRLPVIWLRVPLLWIWLRLSFLWIRAWRLWIQVQEERGSS